MEMEEGYRRGAVLGLTIAEVFILLIFLMLLALMGVNRYWGKRVDPWKEIIDQHTPEQIIAALKHPDERRGEVARLKSEIEELKRQKEQLQNRIRTLEDREGTTGKLLDEAEEELRELGVTLAEQERALVQANDKIRIIGKGITPPCWYQPVHEANPITQANWREKPYYLLDIAIREDHMEVQRLPVPEGSAEDDNGRPYAAEAKDLPLDEIPYGERLTDVEVRRAMSPLYERAKASQVRTYSCIFYVRVWDETPSGAKDRWKRAHDGVLEQLFGTHQVRGTTWEDRGQEPVNVRVNQGDREPVNVGGNLDWRDLEIAPENRCSEYDRERDYPYSQSLERHILQKLGAIRCMYTDRVFDSLRDTEIEHIVALSEAHDSGLCGADAETRREFSSDLLNLTLADPVVNHEKSGKDPGEWLPEVNRLWYARRVLAVKRKYGLTIDRREQEALQEVLLNLETAAKPAPAGSNADSLQ